jgi:hypothetical protein
MTRTELDDLSGIFPEITTNGGLLVLSVRFGNLSGYFNIDDVSMQICENCAISAPVPLPAALPLFAAGLGVLGLLGWRRKRRAARAA